MVILFSARVDVFDRLLGRGNGLAAANATASSISCKTSVLDGLQLASS